MRGTAVRDADATSKELAALGGSLQDVVTRLNVRAAADDGMPTARTLKNCSSVTVNPATGP